MRRALFAAPVVLAVVACSRTKPPLTPVAPGVSADRPLASLSDPERADVQAGVDAWSAYDSDLGDDARGVCASFAWLAGELGSMGDTRECLGPPGNQTCRVLSPGRPAAELRAGCEKVFDMCAEHGPIMGLLASPRHPRVPRPGVPCDATVGELRECLEGQRRGRIAVTRLGRDVCQHVGDEGLARTMTVCTRLSMKCPTLFGGPSG